LKHLDHREAVDAGHSKVEQNGIRLQAVEQEIEGALPILGFDNVVSGTFQLQPGHEPDLWVVVHDEQL
jgi:hypothetical protein